KEIGILNSELKYDRKHLDKIWGNLSEIKERLQGLELHMNFNTRLLSIICSEKLAIKDREILSLVRRIKKDTEQEIQIKALDELFEKKSRKKRNRE
ncbi:MAG: hypothetical protein U9R31_02555, partial [Candidatus Omnitrophota bacterium]|nr:hypothetical protein [Candidatus Omnitrophota bacterium]